MTPSGNMVPTAMLQALLRRSPVPASAPFDRKRRTIVACAILLFLVTLFARSWQNLLNPGLYMEDASHYFNLYYGIRRELIFILQHPNGYYNIANNLVAWVASLADVRLQPLIYLLVAALTGCGVATILLFSGLLHNRVIILITPLVLGLSGLNHIFYYTTLTFQMYNVVVLLLCLLLFPPPRSILMLAVQCASATLLVWSGPYSVLALPIAALLLILFRNGHKTVLLAVTIINTILYSMSVKANTIKLDNIFNEEIRDTATRIFFEKILLLDLLDKPSWFAGIAVAGFIALALYLLRSQTCYLKLSLIVFAIIIGALAPLFLSVKFLLYQSVFPCHLYISQFFWLVFILLTIDRLLSAYPASRILCSIFPVLLVCTVVIDNVRHPEKGHIEIMTKIPAFLDAIHAVEQLDLGQDNRYAVIKTENMIPDLLEPMVRVGSFRLDATRVRRRDLPPKAASNFVID